MTRGGRPSSRRSARRSRRPASAGLEAHLDRDPAGLSQGEKRRVQAALALSKPADLYAFDEPLSNVDGSGRELLMDAILEESDGAALPADLEALPA